MENNSVCKLFGIKYPIIAGGMVWCSSWQLAAAVSNEGGLGLIGSASMNTDVLREHIQKCKKATQKPFGVNVAINIRAKAEDHIKIILEEKVPVVFTSAGSPKLFTKELHEHGVIVVHVVPSLKLALKCVEAGVDAIVAEGFEAGGHNGMEETATLPLIHHIRPNLPKEMPLIAAGGIASGRSIAAVFAIGADGVQIGTRFALTKESGAAQATKDRLVAAKEGETVLTMKVAGPTRLLQNSFGKKMRELSDSGVSKDELMAVYGKHNTRRGLHEGDVENGEIDIGQVVADCNDIPSVAELMVSLVAEFNETTTKMAALKM
ncbi:enoyl-[acyl carrier protein] reductase II [Strigomonas culicis]|uniref:Enoyl-[acyl carrier protein] reductase II n=1 Tax=Strigomonas culicis TaxID=28005 RepID=S9UYR0_9TRYP|nr:enoyl-[acyl carrier protein] reductase II [Strigomonas culicis]EPY34201.1 enoyl-[acyl carrier protein] reductase II [Strigomonas culicis]EPY35982.1 enoyl-[acyl carrier protein] reductase II [Strigomonas culicis]|eukprot:EPY19081.1 enoyl-[acyl carrier protein] reductase II [Strigomonas culicis]